MCICGHACSCFCWHCTFSFFKSTRGAKRLHVSLGNQGDLKSCQLLLGLIKISSLSVLINTSCLFLVSQCPASLWHLALLHYGYNLFHSVLSGHLAMHSKGYWCHCSPSHPHSGGETVCALSAHQIPAGPLWSTGGEFREQPLVVPTQQHSFTEGLIKPDNIPSAWALLFSQLNVKWQLKASPRCRY